MKNRKRKFVDIQDVHVVHGSENSYENYTDKFGESPLGDTDLLPYTSNGPSTPQEIMGEAVSHLQGRQKEVYLLVMREDRSLADVAYILRLSKSSTQTYLTRAIRFITAYCNQALIKGRV